jgi:hypothetical protein
MIFSSAGIFGRFAPLRRCSVKGGNFQSQLIERRPADPIEKVPG